MNSRIEKKSLERPVQEEIRMMKASDLNYETMKAINLSTEPLKPGSKATPFSIFLWAVVSGDIATAESQITDDIEWGLMPYSKLLKAKGEVVPWLKAGCADQKEPVIISNALANN